MVRIDIMLSLDPSDCLVVEDVHAGIEAAVNGGFDTVAIGDAWDDKHATYRLYTFSDLLGVTGV